MNPWLLWNYFLLETHKEEPPQIVREELERRASFFQTPTAQRVKEFLTPDQWRWVEFFHAQENAALNSSDPGVGKSLQAIGAMMVEDPDMPVLIVTIKGCKHQWKDELLKLGYQKPIKILDGRTFEIPFEGAVITNWENLPPLAKEGQDLIPLEQHLFKLPPRLYVIGDEVQKTKNTKANITKRWRKLTSTILKKPGNKLIGLTATPVENRPQEIFSVMTGLCLVKKAFGNYDNFCRMFGGQMNRWLKIMEFEDSRRDNNTIAHRLSTCMFRIKRPRSRERLEREILVDIKANKTLDDLQAKTESLNDQETLKLAMTFENLTKIKTALAKEKQKAAMDLIDSLADTGPILVTGCSVEAIQAVGKQKGWACITGDTTARQRQELKNKFNSGELAGLAFTVGAGGVGLNLPVAQTMVILDLHYNAALNKQAMGRNDRHDTQHSVLNYYFVLANHPFEKRLQRIYREKTRLLEDVLDSGLEEC